MRDKHKIEEEKHRHDQEFLFRATARRNKLAGLWAAGLLGLEGDAARDYAGGIVASDLEEPGDEDVVRALARDLAGKVTADEIRAKLAELFEEAKRQLAVQPGGGPSA